MGGVNVFDLTHRGTVLRERVVAMVFLLLAAAGLLLGWNQGNLPEREPGETALATAGQEIAPDLALYRDVIAGVRGGRGYYAIASEKIPQYGFPISSPLNWRLPTYAWVLSRLPGPAWIQGLLVTLAAGALTLTFVAQTRVSGVGIAAMTTFLLFGVVRWAIDGEAYLAQEPWAATLILISLAATALASGNQQWQIVAVLSGIMALLFRELALPYCVAACAVAAWRRRWWEMAGWAAGIGLFFAFLAWHAGQVQAQLVGMDIPAAAGSGLGQWLRFGGLDFVLLTTRMNGLLFAAPGWLLWLYVLVALVGLSRNRSQESEVACVAALLYLLAFAIVGRPENFYWGLMPAPLLAWGAVSGSISICNHLQTMSGNTNYH